MTNTMEKKETIKQSRFPFYAFGISYVILLLMSGVHVGLIVGMNKAGFHAVIQSAVPIVYWGAVSVGLVIYTAGQVRKTYELPMKKLAQATRQVAQGDFSVYVQPTHTAERLDYLDVMLMDFNKMVEELGSIETLKTDFFSNVSHEIKTPLAVIQSNAELLNKDVTESQKKICTENILHATKRLSSLITNMLKLNKLEKQTIAPMPKKYDLCEQLCECALQFEDTWEKKGIEFTMQTEDFRTIECDAGLLELVWTNLLSNAMKFTQQGGSVTLTQEFAEDKILVSISDTGCGMDEKTLTRVFDKFYQGDTSHATEGNGLGLALVKRIIQMTDGAIRVESELGRGTTFTVELPISMKKEDGEYERNGK